MDWQPLLLSVEVAAVATTMAAVMGIGIAALLANHRFRGRELLDAVITAPMVLPPTVLGYYVLVFVGRRSFIGRAFEAVTGSSIAFTKSGAVVAAVLSALPMIVKATRAAIENVDTNLIYAARTLGASPWRVFFTVTLPLSSGGTIAGLMLGFARALGDFGVTLMVAGNIPGETQTASLAIYDAIQANRQNDAIGMITVLSVVAIVALYGVNRLARHDR